MNKKTFLIGCAALFTATISAQQTTDKAIDSTKVNLLSEAVVSGTRFKVPVKKSGKTIYKISSEQIEKNAGKTVVDILNEVPGVQMEGQYGSPGTNISYFVRGGRNKNTLILIDGVPLNDPSGINASFDLRLLSLSQVESIEVLKGSLSTLYGTGASSSVINIKLKESTADPKGTLNSNFGSYSTVNTNVNLSDRIEKFSYFISGNYSVSEGFSSASDENSPTPFGDDGFTQKNSLLKFGYDFSDRFKVLVTGGYDEFETEYDDSGFTDGENIQKGKLKRFGILPSYKYNTGEIKLNALYINNEREFISSFPAAYTGNNMQLDLTNRHNFNETITLLSGLNYQDLSYKEGASSDYSDTQFQIFDPYTSLFLDYDFGLNVHAGARLNTHSVYGSKFVYNLNPSYTFDVAEQSKLKFIVAASTSYITPTGYQLFSDSGNRNLNPEESLNLEVGFSYYAGKKFTFNAAAFKRYEENAIGYESKYDGQGNWIGGQYQNIEGERIVEGVEIDFTHIFSKSFNLRGNYTYANTEDVSTFYRIPKQTFGLGATINPSENTSVTIKYNFTGSRTIFDFGSSSEIILADYGLLDLYAQQKIYKNKVTLYGAINNLLDKDFVSVYGYTTRGINYNIGLNYNF